MASQAQPSAAVSSTQAIIEELQEMALDPSLEDCCRCDKIASAAATCISMSKQAILFARPHVCCYQRHATVLLLSWTGWWWVAGASQAC